MYVPVKIKFIFALTLATLWLAFCTWFSFPWIEDLANYIPMVFAVLIIAFVALLPGFMNMFFLMGYLIDKRKKPPSLEKYPGLSILIPAYNEEKFILDTLTALAKQDYKGKMEIILIDDGSTDNTIEVVKSLSLENLVLIQNKHGGKANSLNTGLARSTYDLIIGIDADTHLWPNALTKIVEQLEFDPPHTAAVAGSVYVKNTRTNLMTGMQQWDYFQSIITIKRMQSLFQGTLVAQGAFSIYRKKCLQENGGWPSTVGEDIVVTWGMLANDYRVGFAEDALAFTNVPTTYKAFFHQRSRWSRGLLEAFRIYPQLLIKPRLSTFIVYWNLLFPLLDLTYLLIFIPGIFLAFFGYFFIAGPLTLAVLPLALLLNMFSFLGQRKLFYWHKLFVRKNISAFILFVLFYQAMMVPACVHGYLSEFVRRKKKWGTK